MALEIGIVGLPNVGKSTLFNALTRAEAQVAGYPFTTIDPNVGVVPLADPRLDALASLVEPDKVVPASVRFVDIAGLVEGAHMGEGLGNQFLGHIRTVDAVAIVVRCFAAEDIPHVRADLDPVADIETLDTELVLADLATVERRIEKVRTAGRVEPRKHAGELAWLEALTSHLAAGELAHTLTAEIQPEEEAATWLRELDLVTDKPRLYVANVGEDQLPGGGALATQVAAHAAAEGAPTVVLCAALEHELLALEPDEAAAYRAELGLEQPGLDALVAAGYERLELVTFFTTTGGTVVHAWTVPRGATAPEAAGRVHSDMQRGFIAAEVVPVDALLEAGSTAAAREAGLVRREGRDYVVQEGDVIHFRFNV